MIFGLLNNLALLLSLGILYSYISRKWPAGTFYGNLFLGTLFGSIAIVGMMTPLNFSPGIIFDGRSVILGVAALFGGPIIGLISAFIAAVYRVVLGGDGAFTGVLVIFLSMGIGVGYYYLRQINQKIVKPAYLYIFGLVVHIGMLLLMLTLPDTEISYVLTKISFPILTFFPLATVFLGIILLDQERKNEAIIDLKNSESKFRTLFESMAQGVTYQNAAGEIIDANPAAQRILGMTLEAGRTSFDPDWKSIHEDGSDFPGEEHASNIALKTGEQVNDVIMGVFNPNDNDNHWIKIDAVPQFKNGESKPYQVFTTFDDITIRKRIEETIRQRESILTTCQKMAKVGGWQWDVEKQIMFWTDETYRIHEFEKEKFEMGLETHINESLKCYEDEDRKKIASAFNNCIKTGEGYDFTIPFTTAKGNKLWIQTSAEAIVESGKVKKVTGVIQNITERKKIERNLQKSELQYRSQANFLDAIIENSPFAMWIADSNGWLIRVNQVFRDTLEIPSDLDITKYNILDDGNFKNQGLTYILDDVFQNLKISRFEMYWLGSETGENNLSVPKKLWVFGSMFPITDENGKLINVIFQYVDITERKRAEQELKESEQKYRLIAENMSDVISLHDTDANYLYISPSIKTIRGYDPEELLGKNPYDYIHPEDIHLTTDEAHSKRLESGLSTKMVYRFKHKDGHYGWFESNRQPILDKNNKILKIVSSSRDISERVKKDEEIQKSHKELRAMVAHIDNLLEKERILLAREIHDELGQLLTVLKIKLSLLEDDIDALVPHGPVSEYKQEFSKIETLINNAVRNVNNLLSRLRPEILDSVGLVASIEALAEDFIDNTQMEILLEVKPKNLHLGTQKDTIIYRIVQEAITNVARHAQATQIQLSLKKRSSKLLLKIADNGIGFKEKPDDKKIHYGLIGMRERVLSIGGEIKIVSDNHGTVINVEVPL